MGQDSEHNQNNLSIIKIFFILAYFLVINKIFFILFSKMIHVISSRNTISLKLKKIYRKMKINKFIILIYIYGILIIFFGYYFITFWQAEMRLRYINENPPIDKELPLIKTDLVRNCPKILKGKVSTMDYLGIFYTVL